jgi:membrane protein YdbS with pleckstrin-like domain
VKALFRFVFGSAKRWEYRLVMARIVIIAGAIAGFYVFLQSPWKHLATPLFWVVVVAIVLSIGYQYWRRWRELREQRESNH